MGDGINFSEADAAFVGSEMLHSSGGGRRGIHYSKIGGVQATRCNMCTVVDRQDEEQSYMVLCMVRRYSQRRK